MVRTKKSTPRGRAIGTTRSSGIAVNEGTSSGAVPISAIPMMSVPVQPQGRTLRSASAYSKMSSKDSVSSATTPPSDTFGSGSGSGYSTPMTSNIATPAGERLQINIPARPIPADSSQALNKSIYNINRKRKRAEIASSDEDDFSDDSPDAKLARRLQEEEEAEASVICSSSSVATRPGKRVASIDQITSNNNRKAAASKTPTRAKGKAPVTKAPVVKASALGKPKTPATRYGKGSRASARNSGKALISDTDDDELSSVLSELDSADDLDDLEDHFQPVPTRSALRSQRQGTVEDEEEDDDMRDFIASDSESDLESDSDLSEISSQSEDELTTGSRATARRRAAAQRPSDANSRAAAYLQRRFVSRYTQPQLSPREKRDRKKLESSHPELKTLWQDFEALPVLNPGKAEQPKTISRLLKPFQLEGLAWMKAMEKTKWMGGLLGDEMGLGKTIQAVSLIMSDYPAKIPTLVLAPPVALMQWMSEIESYTDGTLKTLVYHGSSTLAKNMTLEGLKKFDVIIMSYNSLESMYRKQEKGFNRKEGLYKEESLIHSLKFHRVILDEAHYIKTRTTMTSKACFALKTKYRWCLTGTPLQNRIGEFFSLIRFLKIEPFANYMCKDCSCSSIEWTMDENHMCSVCDHSMMRHISIFNQELLNPIQKYGNTFLGKDAFQKLHLLTSRIMLRRQKKDHMDAMELPVKEVIIDRQFFGEEELDFADSIMHNNQRRFDTYVSQGVMLNNYANIFGLLMQMRQVCNHPDLILKKDNEGGQNILVCCICDDTAEDAIRSQCRHDFCRACASSYLGSTDQPTCPRCHIGLSIDLEQPEMEQDQELVKKNSIINRIRMEQWTSSTKIEMLVYQLQLLRSPKETHKSIIFSQFTGMLQLIEWRLRRAGITTVMLDGSMTPAQRAASIKHFMTNMEVECFLVSLKAGGVALNLTEASRVFIVDPWWNPAAEWQSADRCHRIGQTRPCIITRLCIEDSIESRIVQLQEKKTKMINSTVNADGAALDSLDPEDLQFLFRGN